MPPRPKTKEAMRVETSQQQHNPAHIMSNTTACGRRRPSQAKDPPPGPANGHLPTSSSIIPRRPVPALVTFLLVVKVLSMSTPSTSANIHLPTLSLCSYIFNQDRSSNRSPRQAPENLARTTTTTTTTTGPMVPQTAPPGFGPRAGSANRQRHAHRHQMSSSSTTTTTVPITLDDLGSDLHDDHADRAHSHRGEAPSRRSLEASSPGAPTEVPPEFVELALSPSYKSPPTKKHPVFIGLEIIDVDRINDAENFFSLQLHLFELWREPRLNTSALNIFWANENDAEGSADHHNDDPIPVNEANIADCLWTPSLVFEDSTEKESLLPPTSILLAYKNNVLARNSRYSLKVRCHMNLQIYPMDKHQCHFKVRTFTDPMHKVDLRWLSDPDSPRRGMLDKYQNLSVIHRGDFTPSLFDIRVGSAERVTHTWLHEKYAVLDVVFIFERRIIHSMLTVYIPSSLVVTLSWLQFWFDVEAVPGRMSLGIMSTLTIMTQILTNYEKAGNHVTAVDIWLFVCLIMVFFALMEYALAYTLSHYYDSVADSLKFKTKHTQTNVLANCASAPSILARAPPNNTKRTLLGNSNTPSAPARLMPPELHKGRSSPTPIDIDRPLSSPAQEQPVTKIDLLPVPVGSLGRCSASGTSQQSTELLTSGDEFEDEEINNNNKEGKLVAELQNRLNASEEKMADALSALARAVRDTGHELDHELGILSERQPATLASMEPGEFEQLQQRLRSRQRMLSELEKMKKKYERRGGGDSDDDDDDGHKGRRRSWMQGNCSHNGHSKLSKVDYLSRYIFPIAFVLFVIVYWIVLIYHKLTS